MVKKWLPCCVLVRGGGDITGRLSSKTTKHTAGRRPLKGCEPPAAAYTSCARSAHTVFCMLTEVWLKLLAVVGVLVIVKMLCVKPYRTSVCLTFVFSSFEIDIWHKHHARVKIPTAPYLPKVNYIYMCICKYLLQYIYVASQKRLQFLFFEQFSSAH